MAALELYQGESKTVSFHVTTQAGVDVNLTNTYVRFSAYRKNREVMVIEKHDGDFDKADAVNGIVTCQFTEDDTSQAPQELTGQLFMDFSDVNKEKSPYLDITISKAYVKGRVEKTGLLDGKIQITV